MKKTYPPSRLIISESIHGADMFYATSFRVADDFVFVEHRGKKSILLSDLEIDRGRQQAAVDEVVSYSALAKKIESRSGTKPTYAKVIATFVKKYATSRVIVPETLPLGLARALEKEGISLKVAEGMFYPERMTKSAKEVRNIKQALCMTETGMERAHEVLKATTIGKRHQLFWGGKPLTSERLRQEVEMALYAAGGLPAGQSIIAGGKQACDPHERGYGPLYANQLIILDLFPRDAETGFYGDLTRTVVRGRASEAQRHLWETCLQGQKTALKKLRPGVSGAPIYEELQHFFTQQGYPREIKNGHWSGFFHGTGHGLGLEVHELPRFDSATFQAGNVFTIEPGLYVPGIGGVRHEDVVVITKTGYRMLSHFPKQLEI